MSCIKKDQVWRSLIGDPVEFSVYKISENGWVNARQVRINPEGKKLPVKGTNLSIHHDTMLQIMKKVS